MDDLVERVVLRRLAEPDARDLFRRDDTAAQHVQRLAQYVHDINAGKRPRCRRVLRPDYVDHLRRRAEANE